MEITALVQTVGPWLAASAPYLVKLRDIAGEEAVIALGNLGNVSSDLNESTVARTLYEEALTISQNCGDRRSEGGFLGNLGLIYAAMGDDRKAIEYFDRRIAFAQETGHRRGEGLAQFNKSLALHRLGETASALALAESALSTLEQIEDHYSKVVQARLDGWRSNRWWQFWK